MVVFFMKRNKFRNSNYNNQGYSLNYKFDSVSPAGKCSGTALDLIKRYNDLAKEAHGNGNYVEAEVFRQYAEHYRKIVTEINERKQRFEPKETNALADNETAVCSSEDSTAEAISEEENTISQDSDANNTLVETKPKKSFKVIEITEEKSDEPKARRVCRSRQKKEDNENIANE